MKCKPSNVFTVSGQGRDHRRFDIRFGHPSGPRVLFLWFWKLQSQVWNVVKSRNFLPEAASLGCSDLAPPGMFYS